VTACHARVAVLISGRGSNLQSLIDAWREGRLQAALVGVVSNEPGAPGLERAERAGLATRIVPHRDFATREAFDAALVEAVDAFEPNLVVLAGFMRILTADFVRRFQGRLINIHPSLLPAFPGLHTHRRALEAGAREHGASVHFVTPELDGGPVIAQAHVPVRADDNPDSLAARVLEREHVLLPRVVRWLAEGRLALTDDGRVLFDGAALDAPLPCDD
jgi:phosphoribosylglycinamide formyltransferase-1